MLNEMNDSSTKIKAILDKFEDIDREAFLEISQIAENDEEYENTTVSILSDAKNIVTQYMIEMTELSESQTALLDNLKLWFNNLGRNEDFLNDEQEKTSDNTNKDGVVDFISSYIQETERKMEKAQIIHSDVSQFWVKQISQIKKEILQKNGEISHLKESIKKLEESNANLKNRRAPKKEKEQKVHNQSNQELMSKIQIQIRTIEEQKNTIDSLKNQLQNAQGQLGLSISSEPSSSENYQLKITEKESEIGRLKFESETQVQMLQQRIQQLEKQARRLQNDAILDREKLQYSENQLNNSQLQIQELEASVRKYIKLLELERSKPHNPESFETVIDTSKEALLEERMLEIAKCKEEIRELKMKHKEELFEQAETLRSKFAIEKQQIFNSLESNDGQALIQSIISEYEKQLDEQKKNYEELKTNLAHQWGSKLSFLTRQYETRLKNQQASNEVTLLRKKEEVQYEVQKAKLELEDVFNKKVLEISQKYSNEMAKAESITNKLKMQNDGLQKEIEGYKEILKIKKSDETVNDNEEDQAELQKNAFNPVEIFLNRTEIIKNELDEQKIWELEQQKMYFIQNYQRMTEENQKELRNLLLSIQDSLSHINSEGENSITISEALSNVSDAFATLNSHCESNDQDEKSVEVTKEEMISLKEASERMNVLKNKIISLTSENNELRKGNPNFGSSSFDSENEQLKMRIKYLESLQKGDTDEAIKTLQEIEQDLRMEVNVKDAIIDQLKSQAYSLSLVNTLVFSKDPVNDSSQNDINDRTIHEAQTKINLNNKDKHHSNLYSINSHTILLQIENTDNNLEIPLEYFEEEEIIDNNEESISSLENSSKLNTEKSKAVIKTKIKTVIRENPKSVYREKTRVDIIKNISNSMAIEIYPKQYNLSFRKGSMMTLEFSSRSNNKGFVETKVIDEKQSEVVSSINQQQELNNEVKITDSPFFEPSSSDLYYLNRRKTNRPHQEKPEILISNQIINAPVDSPKPPPNSPTLKYADAITLTDAKFIEPKTTKHKIALKRSLFISKPTWQINIPNRFVTVVHQAYRIISRAGSKVISEFNICSIQPYPPPPIVITADEETREKIEALQEQFRLLSSSTKEQKIRNDLLHQIPEMTVFFRDRSIDSKERMIDSLHARVAATEDQLKRIREQKLADIRRKSRAFYSVPRGNISGPLIVDPPINNESTQNLNLSAVSSVGIARTEIKINTENENKTLKNESSGPVIKKKDFLVKFDVLNPVSNPPDPMSEIIRILQCNTNFLTNQIEIGDQIVQEFNGDIDSYESYLKATKNLDENNEKFIEQLRQNQKLISEYHSQLSPLNVRQNQVLSLLKGMNKINEKKKTELTNEEKLKMLQKILGEIQENTENSESRVSPTLIIERIQAALNIIDEIGSEYLDEEDNRILRSIRFKVNEFESKLSKNEKIDSSDLDRTLLETQNFISGIKPKIKNQPNEDNQNVLNENEKLKKQVHKIKKERKAAEKELSLLKDKEISLETQLNLLKSRLSEQQELAENSSSLYFAQMASLKSIVSNISNGDQNSDFIDQIKNEIMNLQTILITAVREKDLFKAKANEAEDRLVQTDIEKATAIRELNEIQAKYAKLDSIVKKAYEEKMFYESDITKLKTEKAIEIDAKMKLKAQLSNLVDDNTKINETLKKKSEKVKLLKKQINSLKSENDELTIQATFGLYRHRDIPKTTKATQTTFVRVKKHKNEHNENEDQQNNLKYTLKTENYEKKNISNSNHNNDTDLRIKKNEDDAKNSMQNEKNIEEEEDKGIDENEPIEANFDLINQNLKLSKTNNENEDSQNILLQSNSSLSSTQLEWQEEIDQDTYADAILNTEPTTKQSFESIEKDEKAVSVVHSPLKIKKKKAALFQTPQKAYMSPKSNKVRPKTVVHASRTQINSEELAIGSVTPGKRQLTGATQSPKPIIPSKSQFGYTNVQVLKPLEPLEAVMTTTNYEDKYASTSPVSARGQHISSLSLSNQQQRKAQLQQPQFCYAKAEGDSLSETMRITKYDVEGGLQNSPPKGPIIAPKYSDGVSASQQNMNIFMPKMAEVHKVMVRLREKLLKVQTKLDKKNEIVCDLKKKLADAISENKQQRFAIIKAEDESKRAFHRFESLKIRYDIIFKELSSKEEDLSECKREIYELRKIAAPAASSLSRLKNAQDEQIRIIHEKERQKGMISLAKSAMTNTTSMEVQKHLNMLMRNNQKSIARLEAKRRMWKEVEKKQVMGALGALSLIDDKKSIFSVKKSISNLNDSPFRSKLTKKNRFASSENRINDELSLLIPEISLLQNNRSSLVLRSEQASNFTPVFARQLENINRMKPELSENEKKQIIRGNVQPELEARIKATEKEREEQDRMDNVVITPVKK